MESLQGPINPCLFGEEHVDVETTNKTLGFSCFGQFVSADHHSLSFQEEEEETQLRLRRSESLEDKMPFLEMLQNVESPSYSPLCELSLQALLNLQQQQQSKNNPWDQSHSFRAPEQPESCLTSYHDVLVKSETNNNQQQQVKPPVEEEMEMEMAETRTGRDERGLKTVVKREKRKRMKRMKPAAKNKEEAESQRMTHIAVERNRRRQMNDHLTSLRSLMPASYIQRGDQASIIGGAIDFLKELEQLLQSLQAQKRMKKSELSSDQERGGEGGGGSDTASSTSSSSSSSSSSSTTATENCTEVGITTTTRSKGRSNEFTAEKKSAAADVRVTVIQKHVNLKVECPRIPGQLLKAIVALEGLRLTVLHLNITSFETSIHYSFNLKIEDDCEVGSADGIAVAVHQIFSFVNNGDI
ncbi:Transcription factor bHLH70 [Camellia lanceoleosa]|uniref:Transcription factor bHLH70 n=1 Tax=Camellia lanceoleosa TaxID=1840588 RepID=A0ACC0I9N2_9ERIC|nr:Transcription factor bHLH70 [Camellia lanceoleosa]